MPPQRFRLLDHTGDLALQLWGDDAADLLRSGGIALFHLIAAPSRVHPRQAHQVTAHGADLEEILVAWMNRLLLLHAVEGLLLCRFEPSEPAGGRVRGTVWGEPYDASRHRIQREIKGVTYHGIRVEPEGDRLTARVVLDL